MILSLNPTRRDKPNASSNNESKRTRLKELSDDRLRRSEINVEAVWGEKSFAIPLNRNRDANKIRTTNIKRFVSNIRPPVTISDERIASDPWHKVCLYFVLVNPYKYGVER